ncbi:hypothetical protein EJ04DRAFT_434950 [Polyplosphaeria fusca]|uniref:tRNA(Ile)-lysidine synthetase n=1 Tax=Polyplosphaeria fusca TaxID=682080 RepID=A0A9P4QWX3_9PLEO|nr:hypothetical protein EJ04DRAFT_434950 [Polyplosphaeria fusca]
MALATLYSMASAKRKALPPCHIFIIDHKARDESSEEAQWVSDQVRWKFMFPSTVIPLTWPENTIPADLKSFESNARRLRYQALGQACKAENITTLLTAHHGDDQAETLLMRLIKDRWRSGLAGMRAMNGIPECEGMYGVHHSGGLRQPNLKKRARSQLPFLIESGGLQILRPLLNFEKSRLIATCEHHGTLWKEDSTNHDPTLTIRNAIRHVMAHYKLPASLSQQRLTMLAMRMQDRMRNVEEEAQVLFSKTPIKLDIQTGSLIVRFPPVADLLERSIANETDKNQARDVAYSLIEKIAKLVSPKDTPVVGRFSNSIDFIYPSLSEDPTAFIRPFTHTGILFRVWDRASPFAPASNPKLHHPREWLLTRQPFSREEYAYPSLNIAIPPNSPPTWHFFDSRFWIRVKNHTQHPLLLRPLREKDLESLSQLNTTPRPSRILRAAFNFIKPAELRRTIPALILVDPSDGREHLVALPTLRLTALPPFLSPDDDAFHVEIRYKKCDFGARDAEEVVVPGVWIRDVLAEVKEQERLALRKERRAQMRGEGKEGDARGVDVRKGERGKSVKKRGEETGGREGDGLESK